MADVIGVFFDEDRMALGPKRGREAARRFSRLMACSGLPASGQVLPKAVF
jgi:hypothetical protein